jgi:cystathionine gamma-synthase
VSLRDKNAGFGDSTKAVWSAEEGPFPYGAAVMPIVNAATFAYPDLDSWQRVASGRANGHIYSRNSKPTEAASAFSTGMAAISSTLFALLAPGQRVVSIKDSYGGTNLMFEEFLPRFQINATFQSDLEGCRHYAAECGGEAGRCDRCNR